MLSLLVLLFLAAVCGGCVPESVIEVMVSDHVMFLCVAAVLWATNKTLNETLPPAGRSEFWRFYRNRLPWWPVLQGALAGALLFGRVDVESATSRLSCAFYFGAAGVLAAYWHDLIRTSDKHPRGDA